MTDLAYLSVLKKLLPPGPLWEIEKGSADEKLLAACSQEFERLGQRARALLAELHPDQAMECLPDWERVLEIRRVGSRVERRQRISTRLFDQYSCSKDSIVGFMRERINATLEIEEHDPNAILSERASFTIRVRTPFARWNHEANRRRWPEDAALRAAATAALQSCIEQVLPAHIAVDWEFTHV